MTVVDLAVKGREIAAFDWLVFGHWTALHGPLDLTDDQAEDLFDGGAADVKMRCGRKASGVVIPGVLTRMNLLRCGQCCDRSGYPRGVGSPKNDPKIREKEGWG